MVSVFAISASLLLVAMKELGVGLAVAVLIDALVVRGIVLPSLLILLGRAIWIWWPSRLSPSHRDQWAALDEVDAPQLVSR